MFFSLCLWLARMVGWFEGEWASLLDTFSFKWKRTNAEFGICYVLGGNGGVCVSFTRVYATQYWRLFKILLLFVFVLIININLLKRRATLNIGTGAMRHSRIVLATIHFNAIYVKEKKYVEIYEQRRKAAHSRNQKKQQQNKKWTRQQQFPLVNRISRNEFLFRCIFFFYSSGRLYVVFFSHFWLLLWACQPNQKTSSSFSHDFPLFLMDVPYIFRFRFMFSRYYQACVAFVYRHFFHTRFFFTFFLQKKKNKPNNYSIHIRYNTTTPPLPSNRKENRQKTKINYVTLGFRPFAFLTCPFE